MLSVIETLFTNYVRDYTHVQKIIQALSGKNIVLDHLAIIDLPGQHTGIPTLKKIFSDLGYSQKGEGYLKEKQNDFIWMANGDLPQVVLADFRLDEMPGNIADIITKYRNQTQHTDSLFERVWPIPSCKDYYAVKEFNELLSWVLLFGRCVNHFGINIEYLKDYKDLYEFNEMIKKLDINLNSRGGLVKGDQTKNIAQSSTEGELLKIKLDNEEITVHGPFMEFVWRAPNFTDFIGYQATNVIESVYQDQA